MCPSPNHDAPHPFLTGCRHPRCIPASTSTGHPRLAPVPCLCHHALTDTIHVLPSPHGMYISPNVLPAHADVLPMPSAHPLHATATIQPPPCAPFPSPCVSAIIGVLRLLKLLLPLFLSHLGHATAPPILSHPLASSISPTNMVTSQCWHTWWDEGRERTANVPASHSEPLWTSVRFTSCLKACLYLSGK